MPIRYDITGPVVVITMDRPEAMNALDPEHNAALAAAFARYEADDSLRAAVLIGAGPVSFSAGADLRRGPGRAIAALGDRRHHRRPGNR
jgi:enoyl-CoA hydratase/carnithine racemase